MWFLRKGNIYSLTGKKQTNEAEIFEKQIKIVHLGKDIKCRQSRFFGHVMRKDCLEKFVTTDKLMGKG